MGMEDLHVGHQAQGQGQGHSMVNEEVTMFRATLPHFRRMKAAMKELMKKVIKEVNLKEVNKFFLKDRQCMLQCLLIQQAK